MVEKKYKPKDRAELIQLLKDTSIYLGDIDISQLTDISGAFSTANAKVPRTNRDGLEYWDTSNIVDMSGLFCDTNFDGKGIENRNTSNATDISQIFKNCFHFNANINNWNVSKVTNFREVFHGCKIFDQPLDKWNVGNGTIFDGMFKHCHKFNQYIGNRNINRDVLYQRSKVGELNYKRNNNGKEVHKYKRRYIGMTGLFRNNACLNHSFLEGNFGYILRDSNNIRREKHNKLIVDEFTEQTKERTGGLINNYGRQVSHKMYLILEQFAKLKIFRIRGQGKITSDSVKWLVNKKIDIINSSYIENDKKKMYFGLRTQFMFTNNRDLNLFDDPNTEGRTEVVITE